MDLHQYIDPIIEFVRTHAAWAPLIVAALAFGESLAFISLILPASTVLVAIGALIGAGALDFVPVWIAAAIGAALGDWLSYWLGQKFGGPISRIWPLSRHPDLIPRGHAFVGKYGIAAIFIGRFFGPLRAAVAAGRRHSKNVLVAVPDRECHVGLHLGGGAAGSGRVRLRFCE